LLAAGVGGLGSRSLFIIHLKELDASLRDCVKTLDAYLGFLKLSVYHSQNTEKM